MSEQNNQDMEDDGIPLDGDDDHGDGIHPIDADDHKWRDDQYGRLNGGRRLAAQRVLEVQGDEDLDFMQQAMGKLRPLALDQLQYAKEAGSDQLADRHIRNTSALIGCFARLKAERDEHLDNIGRSR